MISRHPEGVIVEVWVVAGASRDALAGLHQGALKVRTAAPPKGGKANRRVARLVAEAAGGTRGVVVAGRIARRKKVLVRGVEIQAARERLDAHMR